MSLILAGSIWLDSTFKCEKMEEKDAVLDKIKRTYILIGKRAHSKQKVNTKHYYSNRRKIGINYLSICGFQ
jgi:hypothetical protein